MIICKRHVNSPQAQACSNLKEGDNFRGPGRSQVAWQRIARLTVECRTTVEWGWRRTLFPSVCAADTPRQLDCYIGPHADHFLNAKCGNHSLVLKSCACFERPVWKFCIPLVAFLMRWFAGDDFPSPLRQWQAGGLCPYFRANVVRCPWVASLPVKSLV